MHADVIVIGHDCDAFMLSYLFARRAFRTLLIVPDKEAEAAASRLACVEHDLARKLRPVGPPPECVIWNEFTLNLWSPSEKHVVPVRQLPYMVFDTGAFSRYLEMHGTSTGNLRVLRGHAPKAVVQTGGAVHGVVLDTGDEVRARLVVEVDSGSSPLQPHLKELWSFPLTAAYHGLVHLERRTIGAAASAWPLGQYSLFMSGKQEVVSRYRYAPDAVQIGVHLPPGARIKPEAFVARLYREAGLEDSDTAESFGGSPYVGPPLPVIAVSGYLAAGRSAGHCNPFLPMDLTSIFGGIYLAYISATQALEEGDISTVGLWDYCRGIANDWSRRQAYGYQLASALHDLDQKTCDSLFATGIFDAFTVSCLLRNRPVSEDLLDAMTRGLRALRRPGALMAWQSMVRKAGKLAAAYAQAPATFSEGEVRDWQESVVSRW
jgi:flavin-dependent dehydrogenase